MRILVKFLAVCMVCMVVFPGRAETPADGDSIMSLRKLASERPTGDKSSDLLSRRWVQMTYVGAPLVVAGVAVMPGRERFRTLRNDYVPQFHNEYDNYLQYAPAVVMLGLKGFGVESRSSWGRMLVSDAFTAAIMATVVNSVKYTAHVQRPDGSNYKSFPSGHTATAFMAAMMMHKEYGDRSPWYSIAAFSMATATAVGRQLNNRHWISDVLVGAGVGILSTELGYYLADLIFKERGLNFDTPRYYPLIEKPSFAGLYAGFVSGLGRLDLGDGVALRMGVGSRMGFEGAYFFNKYVGCGALATVSNIPVSMENHPELSLSSLDEGRVMAGAYLRYPFTSRWSLGGKALAGYSHVPGRSVGYEAIRLSGDNFVWGAGVSMGYVMKRNLEARMFCDYTSTGVSYDTKPVDGFVLCSETKGARTIHSLTWGAAVNVLF